MSPLMVQRSRSLQYQANFSGRMTSSSGTTVTSDSVANQFPSTYTELISSTNFESRWVRVAFHENYTTAVNSSSLVSIYVGAASSEQILIPYLGAGFAGTAATFAVPMYFSKAYEFPLRIPAGTRISARHQSVRTSQGVNVLFDMWGGDEGLHWTGTKVEAVGYNTADSGGTQVTPGTSSEGTFTSIGTNTYEWGAILPVVIGGIDTSLDNHQLFTDVSLDGGSTAAPGLGQWCASTSSSEYVNFQESRSRFCLVPASSSLYLRSQASTSATEASDHIIYGVY